MPGQLADIIDLKAYREQRSAISQARRGPPSGARSIEVALSPATFVMPAAFFLFWPTWVCAPAFPINYVASGHGVT